MTERITLYDAETNAPLGEITAEQLAILQSYLEEESEEDRDYYISTDTLDMFDTEGAEGGLLAVLQAALGDRDEMTIRWSRRG